MIRIVLINLLFIVELFSCTTFWQPTYINEADFNFIDNSFLKKEDIKNPLYRYAHIPSWAYDKRVEYYQKIKKELNLQEWSSYLNISKDKANSIVYKDTPPTAIKNQKKKEKFIAYKRALGLIKDYDTNWKEVLKSFQSLIKQNPDRFFKTRIAYNIVRAYHNLGEFDKEIAFIDSLQKDNSIVWEWIESYRAGAIQHRGDLVTSAYLFAQIFATHKSDAYIGYYDFKIKTDQEWNRLLKMAKNTQEQTLFHFLRAINPKNSELLELKYMTQINPNSIWVKRLLYLVAQKAQFRAFLLKSGDYQEYYNLEKKDLENYIDRFLEYLKANPNGSFNEYLLSYFEYIYHHKKIPIKDSKHKKLLEYIAFVDSLKGVDENLVSKRLKDIEEIFRGSDIIKNLQKYTMVKLSTLYPQNSIKATLSGYFKEYDRFFDGADFRAGLNLKKLNELVALKDKRDKNYIEKLMLNSKEINLNQNLINLYYAVLYTRDGRFQKALNYAKDLPMPPKYYSDIYDGDKSSSMRVSLYNPFNVSFSGNNRSEKYIKYSHKKFLKTIIKIQKELQKNPNSVMDNLLMANGLYNISDFGNSPMFATIYRDTTIVNRNNLNNIHKAEKFYKKVLKLTDNRELKTKVYYQLLKISLAKEIEKNSKKTQYYRKPTFKEMDTIFELLKRDTEYSQLYKKLLEYQDTKYFNKIKNCATFRYFN